MPRCHNPSRTKSDGLHPIITMAKMNKDHQQNFLNMKKDNKIYKSQFIGFRRFQRAQVFFSLLLFHRLSDSKR
jgi:hypothetical protein